HVPLFDRCLTQAFLGRHHKDVPQAPVTALGTDEDMEAHGLLGPGVISHVQPGIDLNHRALAFSTISTTRKCLSLLSGRVSTSLTRSPIAHSFFSSCAFNRVTRLSTFP